MAFLRGLLTAMLVTVAVARADENDRLRDLSPEGQDACFGRVYDKAHLARNPDQKVERIFFLYGGDPVTRANEEPSQADTGYDGFLATTLRGAGKPEWVAGWCSREDADKLYSPIHCGMECDRHLASLQSDAKGKLTISGVERDLYLDVGAEDELGKAEYQRQALGAGDDDFRLDRMPLAACKAEFGRIDPVDPALGPPLRERLKPDEPFCFGRVYDAAHMTAHPRQVTTSIHVARGAKQLAAYSAEDHANWPNNSGIVVSVTARTGSGPASQTYQCLAEGDQWRCSASGDTVCDLASREIFLRRGANGTMMLANPNGGLPIVDLCSPAGGVETATDDRIYRLSPLPQSACGG